MDPTATALTPGLSDANAAVGELPDISNTEFNFMKKTHFLAKMLELANTDLLTVADDGVSTTTAPRRAVKALEPCLRHTNVSASGKPVHRNSEGVTQSKIYDRAVEGKPNTYCSRKAIPR